MVSAIVTPTSLCRKVTGIPGIVDFGSPGMATDRRRSRREPGGLPENISVIGVICGSHPA
jgi:hypothetical protein